MPRRLLLPALLVLVAACSLAIEQTDRAPSTASPSAAETAVGAPRATTLLAGLPVRSRHPDVPDYERDAFGPAWRDTDGNGCNQRDDVLLRDALPGSTTVGHQGACDHDVLAGSWRDPYTGRTLELDDLKDLGQAQAIQIDHVVPLAEAWLSGAWRWSADRRSAYANDLGVLLAVDGPTNAAKGSDDPAAWRPRKGYQCEYARRWITVKHAWRLAVDTSEVAALEEMLGTC